MHTDQEDRYTEEHRPPGPPVGLIMAGVAVAAGLVYWFLIRPESVSPPPEPPIAVVAAPKPAPVQPPAPDIPEPAPALEPEAEPNEPAVLAEPPATLASSDEELRLRLSVAGNSELLNKTLLKNNLLARLTAVIDSFSRGILLQRILPVAPPKGDFSVLDSGDQLTIDPESYHRYDAYARAIEELDSAALAAAFHRFRPLLEESYAGLGYRAEDVDNAIIRALERILDTPDIEAPIAVKKSEAIYKYLDPDLERRTGLQKQLLRMGPENIARVKAQARALRSALLAT